MPSLGHNSRTKRNLAGVLAVAGGATGSLIAGPALSDTVYILNNANSAISGAGPYGQADVSLTDSTDATITFTAYSTASNQFYLVDGSSVDLNVNSISFTLGTISGNSISGSYNDAGFSPPPVDGRGNFNETINSANSNTNNRSTTITFTLTDTSGTWASDASVLTANNVGNYIAAHIGACDLPSNCVADGASLATTGYAGGSITTAVPEPSTWAMMLAGFALLGFAGYRKAARTTLAA